MSTLWSLVFTLCALLTLATPRPQGPSGTWQSQSQSGSSTSPPELTSIPINPGPPAPVPTLQTPSEPPSSSELPPPQTSSAAGEPSAPPFSGSAIYPSNTLSVPNSLLFASPSPSPAASSTPQAPDVSDAFAASDAAAPPFAAQHSHPIQPVGVNGTGPIQTNKFYANLLLGGQMNPVWTQPYALAFTRNTTDSEGTGFAVWAPPSSSFVFDGAHPPRNFFADARPPARALVFSAAELDFINTTVLTTDHYTQFSVRAHLAPVPGAPSVLSVPLVQGMGLATGLYHTSTPVLRSPRSFSNVTYNGPIGTGVWKYTLALGNGQTWLAYLVPSDSSAPPPGLNLVDGTLHGPPGWSGALQLAVLPPNWKGSDEAAYDAAAGAWAVDASLSGAVQGGQGQYALKWKKGGPAGQLLVFALPHHVAALEAGLRGADTGLRVATVTKGLAAGFLSEELRFVEPDLPGGVGFGPWSPTVGAVGGVGDDAKRRINEAAAKELGEDIYAQAVRPGSMYYGGKALSKFASAIWAADRLGGNASLALTGLEQLKQVFNIFVQNNQTHPLLYDGVWGGVVSSWGYDSSGNVGADFGNVVYNDHHFHWGYFIHTASVIAEMDPGWLTANGGQGKAWVNMLVADFASPAAGQWYPAWRSFDWFHGHSWATGLYERADGKDEESSSEDAFAGYALKMWGQVTGDTGLEARATLLLAVMRRSLNAYYYYTAGRDVGVVQPGGFEGNLVAGILFENKIDHTTWFSPDISCIQGIHMLPISPISAYMRSSAFVSQEWSQYFANGGIDKAQGGWRGVIYADLSIADPGTAWGFFSDPAFDYGNLDGGASLTWYLAYVSGLGGL
ncbi:glycoside hydrolase [Trichodelitschia bisporula]|uniref:glucan endo-1,3-beta-D-glucosidase n=1 Tax=Trichodelitschia bisporula TaxID=703511 RepID=A0A6G1HP80_9PEZI|nr:glycoside hydrolase [Trichodelitschia bisporula]